MTDTAPSAVLAELSPGDRVALYFLRYEMAYDFTPSSPLETTVLDVTETEREMTVAGQTGTLTDVTFAVHEDDPNADVYRMERREVETDDGVQVDCSHLLYETEELIDAFSTSGAVGEIDKIERLDDE